MAKQDSLDPQTRDLVRFAAAIAQGYEPEMRERVGPLRSGVRPFTINGRETLVFTTATGFLGFQVSSLSSGRVLYTQAFPGFSWSPANFAPSAPSHGISLSPNERWVRLSRY